MSTIAEMAAAAHTAKISKYEQFGQDDLIQALMYRQKLTEEHRRGICHGLAVTWLVKFKQGDGADFLKKVRMAPCLDELRALALVFQANQRALLFPVALEHGLAACRDGADDLKEKVFCSIEEPGPHMPNDDLPLEDFGNWLTSSTATRFFLLGVRNHAMAAIGSKTGELLFFDPNGGIVRTKQADKMVLFLKTYLNIARIRGAYKGGYGVRNDRHDRVLMQAKKFK